MARITHVKKAQKAQGKCGKCGKDINVGDAYKWVAIMTSPRSSRRMVRCAECRSWRPSELTTSGPKAAAYGGMEAAEDAIAAALNADDIKSALELASEGLREAAEMYRESAQNMEDGFGHPTSMSDDLNEKADQLDGSADDLEDTDFEAEAPWTVYDADGKMVDEFDNAEDAEEMVDANEGYTSEVDEDALVDSLRDLAYDALGNVDLP